MPQQIGELVVIFCDEIDIALVLDRRLRSLQRLVEVGESLLLVLGRYFLVGLDLCDLRLDHRCLTSALIGHNGGLNKGEFLAHRNVHRSEDETANPTIEGTG